MRTLARRSAVALALLAGLAAASCEYNPNPGTLVLRFSHSADGVALAKDQIANRSPAGYDFSVDLFEYLITDIRLLKADGSSVAVADVHYGNAFEPGVSNRLDREIPLGSYTAISFRWGVEWPEGQVDPPVLGDEFVGMLWPVPMGQGYHCMRLEGDYTVTDPGDRSFQMHMGRTAPAADPQGRVTDASVVLRIDGSNMVVDDGNTWSLRIDIDINGFLNDPLFDWEEESDIPIEGGGFRTLAGPTMPSHMAQGLMRDNMADVFSVASSSK